MLGIPGFYLRIYSTQTYRCHKACANNFFAFSLTEAASLVWPAVVAVAVAIVNMYYIRTAQKTFHCIKLSPFSGRSRTFERGFLL